MQKMINKYFKKLCNDKFFIDDGDVIIGKVKDVIENLEEQIKFANNPENNIDEEHIEFITKEARNLIEDIKKEYTDTNDVIEIMVCQMSGFYYLRDREDLLEELKDYYEDLEEN